MRAKETRDREGFTKLPTKQDDEQLWEEEAAWPSE
jgi:hypothetical protein